VRNRQLVGKNRQLMSFSGNSATQTALLGVPDLASLFSEATAGCWDRGLQKTSPTTQGRSPFQYAPFRVGVTIVPEARWAGRCLG